MAGKHDTVFGVYYFSPDCPYTAKGLMVDLS